VTIAFTPALVQGGLDYQIERKRIRGGGDGAASRAFLPRDRHQLSTGTLCAVAIEILDGTAVRTRPTLPGGRKNDARHIRKATPEAAVSPVASRIPPLYAMPASSFVEVAQLHSS